MPAGNTSGSADSRFCPRHHGAERVWLEAAAGGHAGSAAQRQHASDGREPSCRRRHRAAAHRAGNRSVGHAEHRPGVLGQDRDPGPLRRLPHHRRQNARKPEEIAYFQCVSPQGDIGVYGNLVFRSVDSPQLTDGCTTSSQGGSPDRGRLCSGALAVHRLRGHPDLRHQQPEDIKLIKSVALDCGSHTHTVVPEPSKNRVLIYNSVSGNGPADEPRQVRQPLPRPAVQPRGHRRGPAREPDLGEPASPRSTWASTTACPSRSVTTSASSSARSTWAPARATACHVRSQRSGGPGVMHATSAPTVDLFHSAVFSWDGTKIISGWEPGGGTQPRCQATGAPLAGRSSSRPRR